MTFNYFSLRVLYLRLKQQRRLSSQIEAELL